MKAVVMDDIGSLVLTEIEEPNLVDEEDAIVRVRRAGICGSDLHVLHGRIPGMVPGSVMGHEFTGVVEQVGPGVRDFAVGDRVVGAFTIPCGDAACRPCVTSEHGVCPDLQVLGYGLFYGDLAGAQAEKVRVPNADLALMRIPDQLDDEQALFAGDILTTAYYANVLGGVSPGQVVAVQGCGPVGQFAVQCAHALGAERVVAVDVVEERLKIAERYGAATIDASQSNPSVAIDDHTGGRGADVVIDTVGGDPPVLLKAFDMVRAGGTVSVVGVYSDLEMTIPLVNLFVKGITLRFGGVCPVQRHWSDVLRLVEEGKVDPAGIVTHRLPLEEAMRGYDLFARRAALKVVLEVST
jgi:2-desacetyl-2-hydroxyethyl bacteriochlorophyllide A dehydrogenase